MSPGPEIAVVVPSHDRPVRLRWLLNALEDQTLERERFEVVICHDSSGPDTEDLLRTHPLAKAGVLRHIACPPGSAGPAAKRNAAWRAASAELIAFTDDDCRPPSQWLESALAAARRHPGAIVQGMTVPDPEEGEIVRYAPWVATQRIFPPRPWAQTCNIVYPRQMLDTLDGFDTALGTGEDTDLAERARAAGVPYVGAPEVITWHAVHEFSLPGVIRASWRWRDLPEIVKRHPRLRRDYPLWAFWKTEHPWLLLALPAWFLERRSRAWALLAIPYLVQRTPRLGSRPRARYRALMLLPGVMAADASEVAALAWGSVKHRSLFL